MAEDGATAAPHVYKVVFENDRARVLEVRMKPDESSVLHSHPNYIVYVLDNAKVKFTSASGESAEFDLPAGAVMWRDAEEHATTNVGGTEVRALFFEPK